MKKKLNYRHALVILGFLLILISAGLTFKGLRAFSEWDDTHDIVANKILDIKIQRPFDIKEREKVLVVEKEIVLEYPEEIDTPLEEYVMEKWGSFYGLTALAVFKAESGLREDALNINTNNTIDYGIAQINQVNWKIEGCSLKEIVEWKGNIDCAFIIYDRADGNVGDGKGSFTPWVAYQKDLHLSKLE